VEQHAAALDMAEEAVAKAGALVAPSINPGISASTNSRPSIDMTPSWGCSVVKG